MKLLIGNTGLIGTTLKDSITFDYEFNSKNLEDVLAIDIDPIKTDLYLCCLPAIKWQVNKDPKSDFDNILKILSIISQRNYRNIILYSTIDVYNGTASKSNERSVIPITGLSYGFNRYMFELLVKNVVKHENLLILRLPALFGRYIKKNIIFDLLHKNQIDKINYNSYYQWYNLDKLVNDTSKNIGVTNKFRIVNLFPEPLHTSEILSIFNISKEEVDYMSDPVEYDYTVESMHDGYIESKENILEQIKVFIFNYIK